MLSSNFSHFFSLSCIVQGAFGSAAPAAAPKKPSNDYGFSFGSAPAAAPGKKEDPFANMSLGLPPSGGAAAPQPQQRVPQTMMGGFGGMPQQQPMYMQQGFGGQQPQPQQFGGMQQMYGGMQQPMYGGMQMQQQQQQRPFGF